MKFSTELLYRDGDRKVLVSSDEIGEGIIITSLYASQDGELFAYFFTKGSDEGVLRIAETESGEKVDEIKGVVGSIVFLDDGSYYYIRQYRKDRTPDGIKPPAERVFHRADGGEEMVFGKGIPTQYHMWLEASSDASKALLTLMRGWSSSKVYGGDLKEPAQWKHIYGTGEFLVNHIDYSSGFYFIASYEGAGRGRVLSVREDGSIKLLVRESSCVLKDAMLVEKELLLHYLVDCSSELVSFNLTSRKRHKLPIEHPGSITTVSSGLREAVLVFESFNVPFKLYRYSKGKLKLLLSEELSNGFIVEECWVTSRDGTKVHAFVFRKDGVSADKILLYGYGGFGISLTPTFSPGTVVFVEDGGTYVVANLRGGGEYGEEWHRAGMGRNKQNVFEDFIACAEYFKSKGAKVVAHGVSNGGLLVGAVLTQNPELLDGAVIGYPVLDMLRFPKLHIGKLWVSEYGNPDDPEEREYLLRYSPYHNIRVVEYPPV
ncbi:MAG: prolyl oligopeptidase family serine peptidase, partial [Thermofilaceae archaeon]